MKMFEGTYERVINNVLAKIKSMTFLKDCKISSSNQEIDIRIMSNQGVNTIQIVPSREKLEITAMRKNGVEVYHNFVSIDDVELSIKESLSMF